MKALFLFCLLAVGLSLQAQVAINTDGTAPDNSAMLDVKSTTRGLLAPRMTLAQRNAIVSPATGLMVFQTNGTPGYYYNSGTPAAPVWALVGSNAGQWMTNGTSIYYNLGNVGIGTDSPLEKLHVDGYFYLSNTTSGYPFIRFDNSFSGGNSGLQFKESGINKAYIYYNGFDNSLFINADNSGGFSPDLIVKNGGNIGIGTASPVANLHVIKNLPKYTALFGDDIHAFTGATTLAVGDNSGTALLYVGQTSMYKGFLLWNHNPTPANAQFWVGTYNGSNPLVLQPVGGNVGVRTSAPEALFHVAEESPGYTGLFGTPISSWTSSTNVSIGDNNANSVLYVGQSQDNKGFINWTYDATPANAFFSVGSFSGSNPLVLQSAGGNVGIGTTTPNSKLDVRYNNYNISQLGYNVTKNSYFYHWEISTDGDGQTALYAFRDRSTQNDGIGYAVSEVNSALSAYSFWGDLYSFGLSGFNYNDYNRCGGVLGGLSYGGYWGSLGYKSSSLTSYGGYFTSSANGGGKLPGQANTGIGIGAWGDLMGADIHGKVYGLYVEGENYAMFSNGDVYKNKLDVHLQDNGTGTNTVLYTNVSTDVTVQTSGVATLSNGRANIAFDPSFAASVSAEAPVIVTVTPIGNSNGVYLAEVSASGFAVVENNDGKSSVTVNYIAIGKRAGYENPNLPQELIDAGYTNKMARGLHNDADTKTDGEGLYYENGQLSVGIHPSTLPDPNKRTEEAKQQTTVETGQGDKYHSIGIGNPGQVQPKAAVIEGPVAETAATGTGKPQPVQPVSPKIENNGTKSASSVSSPPDQPVQNK
jgi:hypothetical protein